MNYYIADLHFSHKGVIDMDNRPFKDVQEMERALIHNWNSVVNSGDTVYIVGDFCWGKHDEWLRIIRKLKGSKVLVAGNHDLKDYSPQLRKEFVAIYDYKEVDDQGKKVILNHYPLLFYRHANNPDFYMLCGHVHTTRENFFLEKFVSEMKNEFEEKSLADIPAYNRGQIYNVGAMMPWMQYTPQTLEQIIRNKAAHDAFEVY